jgi:hypothetical protein
MSTGVTEKNFHRSTRTDTISTRSHLHVIANFSKKISHQKSNSPEMSKKISMGKPKPALKPIGQHLVTWSPEISPDTATLLLATSKISAFLQTWESVLEKTNS